MLTFIDGCGSKYPIEDYTWDAGIRDIEVCGNPSLAGPFKCELRGDHVLTVAPIVKGHNVMCSSDPDCSSPYAVDILIVEDGREIWFRRFRWETWDGDHSSVRIEGIYLG